VLQTTSFGFAYSIRLDSHIAVGRTVLCSQGKKNDCGDFTVVGDKGGCDEYIVASGECSGGGIDFVESCAEDDS